MYPGVVMNSSMWDWPLVSCGSMRVAGWTVQAVSSSTALTA
jgi:hypothetical protein